MSISMKDRTVDSLYVDGAFALSESGKLDTISACRDTGNIGRGYDDNTYFPGWVAAVLVYDRPLTDAERTQLESYLRDKYFTSNQPPAVALTSPQDGATYTE